MEIRPVVLSFVIGFGVGVLYWGLRTRSPAPPIIALVGLLGMVLGERAVPFVQETAWPWVSTWWR